MVELTEEQSDEVEALESIYPDEFSLNVDGTEPVYTIRLVPDPSADEEENHVKVALQCRIPAGYPDELPLFEVVVLKGLSKKQTDEVTYSRNATVDPLFDHLTLPLTNPLCMLLRWLPWQMNVPGRTWGWHLFSQWLKPFGSGWWTIT